MDKLHNLTPQAINYGSASNGTVTTPENPRFGADRAETGTVAGDGDVVKLADAAAALDLPESTLRFWIDRRGCPVHRRGGRGRGHATLVDVVAVRRWMDGRNQPATTTAATEHDVMLMYAQRLPDLLAEALFAAYCRIDSNFKYRLAVQVALAWDSVVTEELDRLRLKWPDVPHLDKTPEAINKLKLIV